MTREQLIPIWKHLGVTVTVGITNIKSTERFGNFYETGDELHEK